MSDLFTYLKNASNNSDFKAELSTRGGYITFSNSGRRGGVKYFQIGLDSILQTLKDIYAHLNVFSQIHYCPVKILDLEINRVDHHPLGR